MKDVSAKFPLAIRNSGRRKSTADVYYGGTFLRTLPISSGTVTLDRSSDVRGSGSLVVGDPTLIPRVANSPLAPYSIEIVIKTGVVYQDNTEELIQLGVFRLQDTNWTEATGRIPTVDFFDRMQGIQDANFLGPLDHSGWKVKTLLPKLLKDVYGTRINVTIDGSLANPKLPGGTIFQEDRVDAVNQCLSLMAAEGGFDSYGNYQVTPVKALTQLNTVADAVYTVEGGAYGTMQEAQRGVTRDGLVNGVTVFGATKSDGTMYIGQAFDTDSRSPTYWGSLHLNAAGHVVNVDNNTTFVRTTAQISNDALTSNAQCVAAANAYLLANLGLARSLSLTAACNPALELADIINVAYLDGTNELHMVDSLSIPLGPGDYGITTKTLTYQLSAGT